MRHIVVTKFGNEPNIFGNDLRYGMIGEWEVTKLIKVLAIDKNNFVTYYGKAIWDDEKAKEYFGDNVQFIECMPNDDANELAYDLEPDEFHVLLGPHTYYNGGKNIPAWESIKTSMVPERLLNRVAPQIKLMNSCDGALQFFYMTDRRFLLQAVDLENFPSILYAQNLRVTGYPHPILKSEDYTDVENRYTQIKPFRFDTLWLFEKSIEQFKKNAASTVRPNFLVIPANQVTSDNEISHSRLDKIKEFTKLIGSFVICGKWTHPDAIEYFKTSNADQLLDGLGLDEYNNYLRQSKYALVTFNTDDGPKCFDNNYLTPKYWECVYNGCLTFVEYKGQKLPFIPEELQVSNGAELRDAIDKCEKDETYINKLKTLQFNLVKSEYFSGQYFTDYINNERDFLD